MPFNWLDIVLAGLVLIAVIVGLVKGFVREIIGLIVIVAGILVAASLYKPVASFAGKFIKNPAAANFVGFLLLFLAVLIIGGFLAGLIGKATKGSLGFVNNLLGGIIGCAEGVLIAGAIVFAMLAFPVNKSALMGSKLAPTVYKITKAAVQLVPAELKDQIKTAYGELMAKPEAPVPTAEPAPEPIK
jgi:membrane protein required for colicin V production